MCREPARASLPRVFRTSLFHRAHLERTVHRAGTTLEVAEWQDRR